MIYLKTLFSAPNEIKYLRLNMREAYNYIDRFIICEFNRTHTGTPRKLIFEKYLDEFTEEERKKILYIGADLSAAIDGAQEDSTVTHHRNERLMRGYFARQIDLKNDDIVFSVDADEIIFKEYYKPIIDQLHRISWPFSKSILLPMHQFFYRINYLWTDLIFTHAVACKASAFNRKYPSQWRDRGKKYSEVVGAHFSWCLSIDEMIQKLAMYAHHEDYAHLAKRDILESAVRNKEYPFDPNRAFNIEVLDIQKDNKYYPKSMYEIYDEFKELVGQ